MEGENDLLPADHGHDLQAVREALPLPQRAHRTITAGGIQPNIIPDYGQIWWFVRDANAPWAKENFDKLVNVGKGAEGN